METVTEYLMPIKIVDSKGLEKGETLLEEKDLQITIDESSLAKLKKGGYLVLDFGREIAGGVRVLSRDGRINARMRLGESLGECYAELGEKGAQNDHSARDITVYIPPWSDNEYFQSGFRYLRLDALDGDMTIKSIVARFTHIADEPVGYFKCANERANEIFDTASYTLMLCMQNGSIWDGIKRDRLVWIGDLYPELLAMSDLYDDCSAARNAIDFSRKTTPLPNWMNTMPTYSLWWMMCLGEYVFRTGDVETYYRNREYLTGVINQYDSLVGDAHIGTKIFLDWPSHEGLGVITKEMVEKWQSDGTTPDEYYGVVAIAVIAMQKAIKLYAIDGTDDSVARGIIDRLKKLKGAPKKVKSAKALYILAGLGGNAYDITEGGAEGFSTFMSWVNLTMSHEYGDKEKTAQACLDYYGAMLDVGATTFWEDFDLEWLKNACPIDRLPSNGEECLHGDRGKHCYVGYRHSFCHGWSAGVIDYFTSCILGVKRLSENEISVNPYPVFGDMEGRVTLGNGRSVTVKVTGNEVEVTASQGITVKTP